MASNDDISDQLNIMTKLNNVVERMASSVSKIEGSYETQINTLEKLTLVMNGLAADKTVKDLNQLNETLKNTVSKLGSMNSSVEDAAKQMNKADKAVDSISKSLGGKFLKASVVATGAWKGFTQGIRNVVSLSKAALGFTTSLASGLLNVGASIVSIPLKIFTGLVDMAASASGGSNELLQALENLRKEMGDLNKSGSQVVLQTTKTLKGFSDTGLSTWRVFGTMAERLELVTKLAVTMGATFGKLKQEFIDNGGALLAYQKGLGLTEEQMKAVGDRSITMGKPMSKMLLDITKQTTALGDAFDIDQKLIGKDIGRAIVDVKHFGSVTVKEIGQASVYARKLGVELDKIVGTLDAFETFDTAAENAAKLGQSFGVTVDAFKLMEAQSPADQIDMLRKSFKEAGVDSSNFSRQQLKLLSSTTGLDEATAKQVFSMKNAGTSLDDIKKKSEGAEKKQLSQAEAMAKLADSIERLVKSGPALTGSFFDMFVKGFLRGIQSTQEFRQMIMFIKRDLQTAMRAGVELGRTFEQVFPGVKDFFGGIRDFFRPDRFQKFFKEINQTFTDFFHDVAEGKFSFPELMKKLQKTFFGFFNTSEPAGQKTLKAFTDFTKSLTKIIGQAIPWITEELGKGLQAIADFITNPKSLGDKLKGPAGQGMGMLGQIVEPLVTGLSKAWHNETFQNGLKSFLTAMGDALEKIVKSETFRKISRKVIGALLTTFLAPTLLQTVLGGLTSKIGGMAFKQLGSALFKKGGAGLAEKAAGSGVSKLISTAGPIAALVAAGAAIGKGVNKYTDQITSTMDRSSKVIAAGATGLIDGLTLGLLPDDLLSNLANTFGELSDTVFKAMESVFGKGFADSLKRRLSATFEVFGNIYDTISKLFTGDQESFNKSATELGMSVLRLLTSSFEFMFVQLPLFIGRMTVKVLALASEAIIKIMTAQASLLTGMIDSVFGTDLSSKISKASDIIRKNIDKSGTDISKGMESVSDTISQKSGELTDKYLRTADDQAKIAQQAAKKIGDSQAGATADAHKEVEKSLSGTLSDIHAAKEIQSELSGANAVDLKKLMSDIKEKVGDVDFNILSDDQAQQLAKVGQVTESVKGTIDNISSFFSSFGKLPDVIKGATAAMKKDAIRPAMEAIDNMVTLINQLDSALSDGNLNKVDIKAKLQNVANSVGLGAKSQYTVTNKPVNITVNLTVTMNAEDLEKALVMRANSIIRDRLNFATGEGAGRKGTPQIPETQTNNLQRITPND